MSLHNISELLKTNSYSDPQWATFTSHIRRAKGNACEMCKRKDGILQVHHLFYEAGTPIWDYQDTDVALLCRPCHKAVHEQLQAFRRFVFGKLRPDAFRVLNGALAVALDKYDPLVFCHALAEFVSTPSMVERYAKAWGMASDKVTPERGYAPECEINKGRAALIAMENTSNVPDYNA